MISEFTPHLRNMLFTLWAHSQSGAMTILHTNDASIQSEVSDSSTHSTENHPAAIDNTH
jgi:hypothetical protein